MADAPVLAGTYASHPLATDFAAVVQRIHYRYALEVVDAFALCPFMNDPASAFGRFCVVLSRELVVESARELVLAAPGVVHLIYPLFEGDSHTMERFGNSLHEAVRRESSSRGEAGAPVHATFHPEMDGDPESPQRRVGFVRRAPDPFVQFVPQGLTKGGTQFMDPASFDLAALLAAPAKPRGRVATLTSAELATLADRTRALRADRDTSYGRFLDAFH